MYPQGYFPFPDGVLDTFPKQFLTSNVVGLAKGIAADGGFDRLNMLADALMEAGYENEYVLPHLQQEKRPRMCACAGGNRRSDQKCVICNCGLLEGFHDQTLHKIGQGLDCGCWQGTCWVVQWILGLEQRVIARTPPLPNDPDTRVLELPVVNPGGWFGRVYIIGYTDGFAGWYYLVEAGAADDAIETWVESEFGEPARIPLGHLKDYEVRSRSGHSEGDVSYSCSFAGDGTPYDSDNITVAELPAQGRSYGRGVTTRVVLYYGPSLAHRGVGPIAYANFGPCSVCGVDCHSVVADATLCSAACVSQFARYDASEGSPSDEAYSRGGDSASYQDESHEFDVYGGHD